MSAVVDQQLAGHLRLLGVARNKIATATGLTNYAVDKSLQVAETNPAMSQMLARFLQLWSILNPAPDYLTQIESQRRELESARSAIEQVWLERDRERDAHLRCCQELETLRRQALKKLEIAKNEIAERGERENGLQREIARLRSDIDEPAHIFWNTFLVSFAGSACATIQVSTLNA